jgi:hypothetical protein
LVLLSLLSLASSAFADPTVPDSSATPATGSGELKPAAEAASRELGALLSSQQARGTVTSGLVAHYEFEGNALDSSGNGRHGTLMNGATFTSSGAVGEALDLSNVDGWVVAPAPLSAEPRCSIAFWARIASFGSGSLISQNVSIAGNPGDLHLKPNVGPGSLLYLNLEYAGDLLLAPQPTPSAWHHYAVTFDTTTHTYRSFLNGQEQPMPAVTPIPYCGSDSGADLFVGYWYADIVSDFFDGQIDDLRFYDRALLESETQELFALGQLHSEGRLDVQLRPGAVDQIDNANAHWKGIDQLYGFWFYYRKPGDTQETRFPPPDGVQFQSYGFRMSWNDLDGQGLQAFALASALDCQTPLVCIPGHEPTGALLIRAQFSNPGPSPAEVSLFIFQDLDVGGSFLGDTARSAPPILANEVAMTLVSPTQEAYTRAFSNSPTAQTPHFAVGEQSAIRALLDDAAITELSNTGLPFGPGDLGMVHQWDFTIPAASLSPIAVMETDFDPVVFADGFESGDTLVWSATTP